MTRKPQSFEIRMITQAFLAVMIYSFLPITTTAYRLPPLSQEWSGKKADIFFILDTSGTVTLDNYAQMKKFVTDIIQDFDIGPENIRVGLGRYAEKFELVIPIYNTLKKADLLDRVYQTTTSDGRGNGRLSVGIQAVHKTALTPDVIRKDAATIAVIFTDGRMDNSNWCTENATIVKSERKIALHMIGIGHRVHPIEMSLLASDPKPRHSYHVSGFDKFSDIKDMLSRNMARDQPFIGDSSECGDEENLDVFFIYDDYGLGRKESLRMTELIGSAADRWSMGNGRVRIAAISSNRYQPGVRDFYLGDYIYRNELKDRLAQHARERSPLWQLVKDARDKGHREGEVRFRFILVLDRKFTPEDENMLRREVRKSMYDGIEIFVIQLGREFNRDFLQILPTKPDWLFHFVDMTDLLTRQDDFFHKFCEDVIGGNLSLSNISLPAPTPQSQQQHHPHRYHHHELQEQEREPVVVSEWPREEVNMRPQTAVPLQLEDDKSRNSASHLFLPQCVPLFVCLLVSKRW